MGEILTSAQMRAKEKSAIQSGEVTGRALMERAGQGVVAATFRQFPELEKCKTHAVVLCGPGNNGGDGFVIARALHELGWSVEVCFWGKAEALSDDARHMYEAWAALGAVSPMSVESAAHGTRPTLLFDAMFGIGINRPIPLDCVQAFHAVRQRPEAEDGAECSVVAVDCPSGFDADSGEVLVPDAPEGADEVAQELYCINEVSPRLLHQATDLCVTFHALKLGHCLTEVGSVWPAVVDIGLPRTDPSIVSDPDGPTGSVPPADIPPHEWLQSIAGTGTGGHKYNRGHVLVLGGGCGKGGAGRLAARAALRVGAGLVTLAVPPDAMAENAAQLNAIMLQPLDGVDALEATLQDKQLGSVCLGPGLGVGAATRELVLTALRITAQDGRRAVLDADALSSFAGDPETLFAACHSGVVLTPHEGEFARLFPDLSERQRRAQTSAPSMGKVAAVLQAAERSGCTILLKGEATVLADERGASLINSALYDRRAPWLGTAGAGDVLAGLIAGLSAHEVSKATAPIDIAAAAAWIHVEAALSFGAGLIAEDLPEQLPQVFKEIGF